MLTNYQPELLESIHWGSRENCLPFYELWRSSHLNWTANIASVKLIGTRPRSAWHFQSILCVQFLNNVYAADISLSHTVMLVIMFMCMTFIVEMKDILISKYVWTCVDFPFFSFQMLHMHCSSLYLFKSWYGPICAATSVSLPYQLGAFRMHWVWIADNFIINKKNMHS